MLEFDCVSCASATGLLQSKRHNECYVPTLGLAVPSTLDGSVKVESILHSFKREHYWMEILKYLSLFLLHDRKRVTLFFPQKLQFQIVVVFILFLKRAYA